MLYSSLYINQGKGVRLYYMAIVMDKMYIKGMKDEKLYSTCTEKQLLIAQIIPATNTRMSGNFSESHRKSNKTMLLEKSVGYLGFYSNLLYMS